MSAMYKLKAYFGMVPAEELHDYADEPAYEDERYEPPVRAPRRPVRDAGDWDGRFSLPDEEPPTAERPRVGDEWERRSAGREPLRTAGGLGPAPVDGALALERRSLPVPPPAVPEQRERPAPTRITTLQPASYKEARMIGEHYRDGQPVIMNLTDLEAADAKRLVDFAAGLAFALRGSIDKVTNRVFLLTPADVDVSADDARELGRRSGFRPD